MLEVSVLVALLVANAYLALAELSVVSSKRNRLESLAARKTRGAAAALSLLSRSDDFLSAVQVGITLVGIMSGVYGAATFNDDLSALLAPLPVLGAYAGPLSYGLLVALLTYLSVIIGELVPKQLALGHPERYACLTAPGMVLLVKIFIPVVWLLSKSSAVALLLFGTKPNQTQVITEEDLNSLMSEASRHGAIDEEERDIAARALRMADRPVSAIMTPRVDVLWIRSDEALKSILAKMMSGHSHLPVCGRNADDVLGVVHQRAVMQLLAEGHDRNAPLGDALARLLQPAVMIPSAATVADVVEIMKREKTHFAVVQDEYGGMDGVVSTHDLLESLVGQVAGTKEEEDALVTREDGSLLASSWLTVDELFRELDLSCPEEAHELTVASLLLQELGRVPPVGAILEWKGLRIEVVDKDGPRVDRVLVSLPRA